MKNGNGSVALPGSRIPRSAIWLVVAALLLGAGIVIAVSRSSPGPQTIEQKVQSVAAGLRCVVCEDLSVADSPVQTARDMRAEIERRLRAGHTPEQVTDYFVSRYGEWILFSPPPHGIALIPWVAPILALLAGVGVVLGMLRRRRREPSSEAVRPTAAERTRIARELAALEEPD
jgi:cytochrome c-type biogenesis protein CcmH